MMDIGVEAVEAIPEGTGTDCQASGQIRQSHHAQMNLLLTSALLPSPFEVLQERSCLVLKNSLDHLRLVR